MAISNKGKRKITVNSKNFLWWVYYEDEQTEFDGLQIKIIGKDQSVTLHYGLQQSDEKRYVSLSLGDQKSGTWLPCQKFENEDGIITPSAIAKLITWCSTETDEKHKDQVVLDQIREQLNTPS
jgi:hypothetical protein